MFGLAIFNLHYWGFGVPFLLVGAWYLVRAYRLQRDLKEAMADPSGGRAGQAGERVSVPARASKRYTPPTAPRRPTPPKEKDKGRDKDEDERRTG